MRNPPARHQTQAVPSSVHEQLLVDCELSELTRERALPEPLLLPYELDPAAERAYERIQRGVAALVRLLAGPASWMIEEAMLALQAINASILSELERAYLAADDTRARRNIIVTLGLLRRQGVPRAGASLLRIGRREADEGLLEAVLVQLNDGLAEAFWGRMLQPLEGAGTGPEEERWRS